MLVADADAVAALFDRDGEPGRVMHALASTHGFETVALTSEHGAAAWHDSTVHEFEPVAVDGVDVTGASDAFAGAFLAELHEGDVGRALLTAVAAEGLARTTPDALPTFTEAEVRRVAERVERP